MAGEPAFKSRAVDVTMLPAEALVKQLDALADDHLDHGRRLQAEGVRSAIALVQRVVQTSAISSRRPREIPPERPAGMPGW